MIETLLKSVREKHQQNQIQKEKYIQWRDNPVTRRLMEELEADLIEHLTGYVSFDSMDEAAQGSIATSIYQEKIADVLAWKPVELVKDEDDE